MSRIKLSISLGLSIMFVSLGAFPSLSPALNPGGLVTAFNESISTFAGSDCTTPKTSWDLGGVACAVASGAPDDRRIAWVAPNGAIAQVSNFFSGTLSDSYAIPTGSDPFAQVGTWTVQTIDPSGVASSTAEFVVRNPNLSSVDLSIGTFGPFDISGGNINYRVQMINRGPDAAHNVVISGAVPGGTTFVSETQESGPSFTCTTPSPGSTGPISCVIATLPANETATFSFAFNINPGTPDGTSITNTVSVTSDTNELRQPDNSASTSTLVVSGSTTCSVTCPNVAPVSTTQCTAIVTYASPTTAGTCGSGGEGSNEVVCSPPSGSTFPVGNTAVTCTAPTGDSCSFTVTVQFTGPSTALSITCPSDVTLNSDSLSAGTAIVNYPAPSATGNCPVVTCVPPSGSAFAVGTTAVTCTATDSSGSTSCSFNVTVNDATPGACSLTCPNDTTLTAPTGQCSVVVNYSAPATNGTCGTVTCSPPSGSTFPAGSTLVVCTSSEGASCDFVVTVVPAAAPMITTCASNRTVEITANCEAAIPNLLGEVVASGCNVTLSQSPTAGTVVGPGAYTVTITAENLAGEATCTATVTVQSISSAFTGFFSPVTNPPALNLVNAGRAIPVKFSLNGNKGLDIFAPGYPVSGVITCDASAPPVEVTETVTAGTSSLSYDAASDRYTYVWATQSSWAGTCRQLVVKFKDGCVYVANFSFR